MLLDQIAATISRYNMLPPGGRAGVAVSGGADSVCLLHALVRLGWPVHVLHVNHGLRGAESDADQEFVAGLASALGLPFLAAAGPPGPGNVEAAARQQRLAFFQAARAEHGLAAVATGHTLTDQAETVLFRALRGSGPGGLASILPVTRELLVRPMLGLSREQVRAWLDSEHLAWREDSSNSDRRFTRNRLRHDALPLLEAIVPHASNALARLATIAAADELYWTGEVERVWRPLSAAPGEVVLEAASVAGLDPALGRRVVRYGLQRALGHGAGLSLAQVERVMELARRPEGHGKVAVGRGDVWRSFGLLRMARNPQAGRAHPEAEVSVVESAYNGGSHRIDAEKAPAPWRCRRWEPGDAYQPAGAVRPVKLKDLFQRAKVPSWERLDWPIVLSADRIVWSRRFGVAQWAMAEPGARHVVEVRDRGE